MLFSDKLRAYLHPPLPPPFGFLFAMIPPLIDFG
jgi:hypothetical protein